MKLFELVSVEAVDIWCHGNLLDLLFEFEAETNLLKFVNFPLVNKI